ncbi:hypothetical protein JTE90_027671 [Oedothorax gibbosus]|uniref:Uncharacterized protein n=1 Tax=Oedothorax gibbosus TaxID=931172 RepID=A0AAV6URT3_9ARAC|nr:hypothetical protein JTE90_027671 [Oedothorax gibbosus]
MIIDVATNIQNKFVFIYEWLIKFSIMLFDKGAIAEMVTRAVAAGGGNIAAIGAAGLQAAGTGASKLASATGNAVNNIAESTKAAMAATAGGFNGINYPTNAIAAIAGSAVATAGGMAAVGTAGLSAAGAGAGKIAAATGGAFKNIVEIKAGNPDEGGADFYINNCGIRLPSKGTVIAVGAGAAIAVAGATVLVPAVGFTAAGVKAGTLAAATHSAIGNVAAGSTFASLQSAGVLGLAGTTKAGIAIAGGATGGLIKNKL